MFTKSKSFLFPGIAILIAIAIWLILLNPRSPTNITSQAISQTPTTTAIPPKSTATLTATSQPSLTPSSTLTPTPTNTPTPTLTVTPTPSPTTMWSKTGNAGTLEGWPGWCVKPGDNGNPSIHLSPAEVTSICFNEASTQILASFAIEWTVRVEGGSALLVYGQNNVFYQIVVRPNEGAVAVYEVHNFVSDDRQNLGEVFPATIHTEKDAFNNIKITRPDSTTITLSVNGKDVKEFPDNLFGDHTPIKVGFGITAKEDNEAIIYLDALNIYALAK